MRIVAKTLLVLSILAGLTLPNAIGRAHDVSCDAPGECREAGLTDCLDLHSCHDCPPPEECPCDHGDHGGDSQLPDHEEGGCPSHEHHHHHHPCACAASALWLIADSDALALHPPLPGNTMAAREHLLPPESPVFLFDRPPMA